MFKAKSTNKTYAGQIPKKLIEECEKYRASVLKNQGTYRKGDLLEEALRLFLSKAKENNDREYAGK